MKYLTVKKIEALHKKHSGGDYKREYAHCKAVARLAVKFGRKISGVDLKFIETASLIHDIGRYSCPVGTTMGIRHGLVGGIILRMEGVDNAYIRVCEKHVGAGISKAEVIRQGLNLPKRDYIPITKEEKIIAHADNLMKGAKEMSVKYVVDRFTNEINSRAGKLAQKLADEVEGMMK